MVARWLEANLLTLNVLKTNYICFALTNRTLPSQTYQIVLHTCHEPNAATCNCNDLHRATSVKYLGVEIDYRLTWYPHIDLLVGRLRKLIWIFKILRHVASLDLLNRIYVTLAQSVLSYCISVWGGASKIKFLELERAQRSLLKVMYLKPYLFPTGKLYEYGGLLSVRKLYILNTTLRTHRCTIFQPIVPTKRRRDKIADIKIAKTHFASKQSVIQSARLYNIVNKELNIHPLTYTVCKKRISNWLISLTYDDTEGLLRVIK